MTRILPLALGCVLVVVACAGTDDGGDPTTSTITPPSSTTTRPDGPADLVLQVADEGGFVPVEFNLARMPRYSLYSDGSLYYEGAVPAIFPGPLLPNVQVALVEPADYDELLEQIDRVGLPEVVDEINNAAASHVADASTVIATFFDGSGRHRYGVYALGIGEFEDPRAAELSSLIQMIDRITAQVPAESYAPGSLQIWLGQAQFVDPQFSRIDPWVFEFDPTEPAPQPFGFACTVLEGSAAAEAFAVFSAAHQQTFWERDGVQWQLIPVPVLPGQQGCSGLE